MDKKYWEQYYIENDTNKKPSEFARYCLQNEMRNDFVGYRPTVLELGSGDGRDAIYFDKNGFDVVALEQVKQCCDYMNSVFKPGSAAVESDFTNASFGIYDYIYSRFTLHSISKEDQDKLFSNIPKMLRENGRLMIEVRSINDPLYGKGKKVAKDTFVYNGHSRRFVSMKSLVDNLVAVGLKISYVAESQGWAPHKDSDPPIIRLFATKH